MKFHNVICREKFDKFPYYKDEGGGKWSSKIGQSRSAVKHRQNKTRGGEGLKQFTFYKLYSDILDGMNDTDAGKFAMRICAFEGKLPKEELNDKERFYWNNIVDMLEEVKEAESSGKSLKRYNLRSEHFTFYETYFDAMKLLKENELGAFVKAICGYMFQGTEPRIKDVSIQGYFNICRLKMDTSKKRKSSGSKGGISKKRKVPTVKTDSIKKNACLLQESSAEEVFLLPLIYEQFRSAYPDVQGDLFGSAERYKTALGWSDVAVKLAADEELKNARNIFHLVRRYEQKYMQKP